MPKKNVRFQPIFVAKIARDLKLGKQRKDIAQDLSRRFGVPFETAKFLAYRLFPVRQIGSQSGQGHFEKAINDLLWKYRFGLKNKTDYSRIAKEKWANLSPQQKKAKVEALHKGSSKVSSEERSKSQIQRFEKLSPDKRRKLTEKAPSARRKQFISSNDRTQTSKELLAELKRLERTWKERAHNISYVDNLPFLNPLVIGERNFLFIQHFERLKNEGAENKDGQFEILPFAQYYPKWTGWKDFPQFQKVFLRAILEALNKWDKKRDLKQLVDDTVLWRVFNYFDQHLEN